MQPLQLEFLSAGSPSNKPSLIVTFNSYQFERNLLSPAASFRFTAPGVDRDVRMSVRSGDTVQLFAFDGTGKRWPIAMGFVDETDTHIIGGNVEYILSGRDVLGQLVDNASVDVNNNVLYIQKASLKYICGKVLANTRVPQGITLSQVPNGQYMFSSNPGETKMGALQKMLEFANLLVWSTPDGQMIVGKPNFTQQVSGQLLMQYAGKNNNILEASVRRNVNQAVRICVTQLQDLQSVSPAALPAVTQINADSDVQETADQGVGRSVYQTFDYGDGGDTINLITHVGNQSANYQSIGAAISNRVIAMENMKVLDIEVVVRDHTNSFGGIYNIDQIYDVSIDDEEISSPMYCYSVTYEMTLQTGCITRLRLCKLNTIVSGGRAV